MGLSFDAFTAGTRPKIRPMRTENTTATRMAGTLSAVGVSMNLKHTAPTALGMTVGAESELVEIDGRRLVFKITAYDKAGVIGTAEHERMIVNGDRMLEKAAARFNA